MDFKKKSLLLNFSGYTIINLFNSLTPFIVLPILTSNLTSKDIGVIDLFTTSSIFITPLIGLCFTQSISKLYYVYQDRKSYLSSLFSYVILFGVVSIILSACILLIPNFVPVENEIKLLIFSAIIYVLLNIIIEGFLLLKRNEEKIKQFATIRLFKSILEILLTVVLLFFIENYLFRIIAIVSATVITSIYVLYLLMYKNGLTFTLKKKIGKRIFIFSIPLVFHTFFASILNYADRYFIADMLGVSELGTYSVVYQLCMVMSLLINSFNMAWTPHFMKNMTVNKQKFEKKLRNIFKQYSLILLLFSGFLYFIMPFIYKFYVGETYKVDSIIYATILIAYFFNGLYRFKVSYLFYYEKTVAVAKLSFITAIVNLTFNYICINKYGILGAAISTLISYFVLYLMLEKILFKMKRNEKITTVL